MKILPNEETEKPFKPFSILIESADEAWAIENLMYSDESPFSEYDYSNFHAARILAEKG
jgi:hypothetical protein